jgi:8-oxo-dGTP pyrophosphatase MutT (NUDIX family)
MALENAWILQAAAIPVRHGQVALVTSSSGKRWVVPKGVIEDGKSAGEIALQEAWEEAGLVGLLHQQPVGSYLYEKWGSTCHVTVFLMEVTEEAEVFPEQDLRQRVWVSPTQALVRVDEPGLREVLRFVMRSPGGSRLLEPQLTV